MFCEICYAAKISPKLDIVSRALTDELKTLSIFEWIPNESDLLSEMVYRLKGNRCVHAWEFYVNLCLQALKSELDINKIDYIVPVPSAKKTSVHAAIFAKLAAEQLRKPVLPILINGSCDTEPAQKAKSKHERSELQISVHEQFTQKFDLLDLKTKNILVVDDITTTGNSFKHVVRALGTPKSSFLLTVFYRAAALKGILVS